MGVVVYKSYSMGPMPLMAFSEGVFVISHGIQRSECLQEGILFDKRNFGFFHVGSWGVLGKCMGAMGFLLRFFIFIFVVFFYFCRSPKKVPVITWWFNKLNLLKL